LPEGSFALLACPIELENPAPALDWLTLDLGLPLKRALKFIAVNNKFSAPRGISTVNVETNYPVELARLVTHANWGKSANARLVPPQFRDARALFCLQRLLETHGDIDAVLLIHSKPCKDDDLTRFLQGRSSGPFQWLERETQDMATTSASPILFDRTHAQATEALKLAMDFALTGAIYGIAPYSFEALLDQSTRAAAMIARHAQSTGTAGPC
jgi:hypothetical protein